MSMRWFAMVLVCAVALSGQKRMNWQNLCFKNPGSPVCQGRDYATKPPAREPSPEKKGAGVQSVTHVVSPAQHSASPAVIAVGGIDWRFADPSADALVGVNFSRLVSSTLARNLIVRLGAQQGISEAEMNKIADGLSDVDQVALSFHENRMVAMVTGRVTDAGFPPPEAGMKIAPVSASVMLVGHEDAVDQAIRRIAIKIPLIDDVAKLAEESQSRSELWAIGSAALLGPQAVSGGVKRFLLNVSVRDNLTSDLTIEFYRTPDMSTLHAWQTTLGTAAIEGNALHVRISIEAGEVEQKFGLIAAGPVGQRLGALLQAARYLPAHESTPSSPKATKPVIYGLDGGPREVNQQ
jgi:hypothetical protein